MDTAIKVRHACSFISASEVNKGAFHKVFPSTEIENVIRKPFSPSRLAEIVKEAFAAREDNRS